MKVDIRKKKQENRKMKKKIYVNRFLFIKVLNFFFNMYEKNRKK